MLPARGSAAAPSTGVHDRRRHHAGADWRRLSDQGRSCSDRADAGRTSDARRHAGRHRPRAERAEVFELVERAQVESFRVRRSRWTAPRRPPFRRDRRAPGHPGDPAFARSLPRWPIGRGYPPRSGARGSRRRRRAAPDSTLPQARRSRTCGGRVARRCRAHWCRRSSPRIPPRPADARSRHPEPHHPAHAVCA